MSEEQAEETQAEVQKAVVDGWWDVRCGRFKSLVVADTFEQAVKTFVFHHGLDEDSEIVCEAHSSLPEAGTDAIYIAEAEPLYVRGVNVTAIPEWQKASNLVRGRLE